MIKLCPDLPASKYYEYACDGVPCLSQGIAHTLVCESPAKAYLQHPQFGKAPRKVTDDMEKGSAFHSLILGKGADVVVVEADNFKGGHAQEMRDIARSANKVPILAKDYKLIQEAAEVARRKIEAEGHAFDGQSEVAVYWEETASDGTVVQCCGCFDHLRTQARAFDIKKCASANPADLPRHMIDFGYDIQEVAYRRALCAVFPDLAGREGFWFHFCELPPPHLYSPMQCAGTMLVLGETKWRLAIETWAQCLRTGVWPDFVNTTRRAEAPTWELNRWMAA
jgi:hypothetical protein